MNEQKQAELKNAIHNFVIGLSEVSSKQYVVDFLKDEIDDIRKGANQQENIENKIDNKEDILDELNKIIKLIKKSRPEEINNEYIYSAFSDLVDLKMSLRRT